MENPQLLAYPQYPVEDAPVKAASDIRLVVPGSLSKKLKPSDFEDLNKMLRGNRHQRRGGMSKCKKLGIRVVF